MNSYKIEQFLNTCSKTHTELIKTTALVERLKEECAKSHTVEQSLRVQLTKAQDRCIDLQRGVNAFKTLAEKAQEQSNSLITQGNVIEELRKKITELQSASAEKLATVTKEVELSMELARLKIQRQDQDAQFNLLRIEHKEEINEKDKRIQQLEEALDNLTTDMEKTKLDYDMIKNDLDRVHLTYNKQNMAYAATIRQYEKERLENAGRKDVPSLNVATDSEILATEQIWDKKGSVTWADSARKSSLTKTAKIKAAPYTSYDKEPSIQVPSSLQAVEPKRALFRPKNKTNLASAVVKPVVISPAAAPLAVKMVKDDDGQPKKKKLYTSNSNHFTF